jgi:hypothetical protein
MKSSFDHSLITSLAIACLLLGCSGAGSKSRVTLAGETTPATLDERFPLVAKPTETVRLTGKDLKSDKLYQARFTLADGSIKDVPLSVVDAETATFAMPEGLGLGEKSFDVVIGSRTINTFKIVANTADNPLNIFTGSASDICSSVSFVNASGETKTGTKDCAATGSVAECTADGATGCVTTSSYKSAAMSAVTTGNIRSGVTIAGVAGDYTGTAAPNAWDLRAGVTVGSTTGKLKVDCRNGATLGAWDHGIPKAATIDDGSDKITIVDHGWENTDQVRVTYTGSPDGLDANTTYYVVNKSDDDFELESSIGGGTIDILAEGSDVYVYALGGGVTDIWDSIDDYLGAAQSTPSYTGWSSNNLCDGIEATADDDKVWKDVTTAGTGGASCANSPAGSPERCSLRDKITGLEWSKPDGSLRNWGQAVMYCDGLTYNGQSDWRLPTQKELMAIYNHGIVSTVVHTNWLSLGDLQSYYWSSSSNAGNTYYAWYVNLAFGHTFNGLRFYAYRVICVRP